MKTLNLIIAIFLLTGFNISVTAQEKNNDQMKISSPVTESFKVLGNCDMCKTRIEKAVHIEGVKNASWDAKTQLLKITYDPSKTSKDALSKLVASAGHDTEKYKAADDVYAKLPGCCHYERMK